MAKNTPPSKRVSLCFLKINMNTKSNAVAPIATSTSVEAAVLNGSCVIVAVNPRIKNTLKIFDPTILPTAISSCFLRVATTDVASSGNDVPTPTIVSPINASLSPAVCATFTASVTKIFPPSTKPARPKTMNPMDSSTPYSLISSAPSAFNSFLSDQAMATM